jgi:gamma-glutamylcyclotransferase (GGCT)/AIG2-like uncharacterized protein YtfP
VRADGLFVYGSLRFPEVLTTLLGRVPALAPAAVEGWRVAALRGRNYPGLAPGDAVADGRLLTTLTLDEWRVLDAFEGTAYELRRLPLTNNGQAWAYVWNDLGEVTENDWSPESFESQHLPAFVEMCRQWRHHGRHLSR